MNRHQRVSVYCLDSLSCFTFCVKLSPPGSSHHLWPHFGYHSPSLFKKVSLFWAKISQFGNNFVISLETDLGLRECWRLIMHIFQTGLQPNNFWLKKIDANWVSKYDFQLDKMELVLVYDNLVTIWENRLFL